MVVAGREDEERVLAGHRLDRVADRGRPGRAAEAAVDDVGVVGAGVVDRADDRAPRQGSGGVPRPHRHDRDVPVDARDVGGVVALGPDRPGDVRAVAVVVERRVVVLDEVPAAGVVDPAVAVVVDAVARDLAGVRPDVVVQLGMVVGDAAVDDGDDDARAAGLRVPGLGRVDVGVVRLVEPLEQVEVGIVRRAQQAVEVVRLGEGDARVALEGRHRGANRGAVAEAYERQARPAERAHHEGAPRREGPRAARDRRVAAELDDDLPRHELRRGRSRGGAGRRSRADAHRRPTRRPRARGRSRRRKAAASCSSSRQDLGPS